jgi:Cu+-exporting ATPase
MNCHSPFDGIAKAEIGAADISRYLRHICFTPRAGIERYNLDVRKPKVVSIVAAPGFQEAEILRLAASVERASEHPLADAIVTLLKGDLGGIVRARRLSQATMSNIRQNLFFAFIYNAAGIPIAAGILYPTFGILLSPIIAAAAMALSSVSVVGNALRLRVTRL